MGPMGLNPPNIYVTSILVRSVQVLCTIGVITADRVAKKAKNEGKLPFYGYFLAIWVGLWRRDSNHSNIYWHPWFGPILSTFGCLEVSFAENSHLSLTRCFRGTSSFEFEYLCRKRYTWQKYKCDICMMIYMGRLILGGRYFASGATRERQHDRWFTSQFSFLKDDILSLDKYNAIPLTKSNLQDLTKGWILNQYDYISIERNYLLNIVSLTYLILCVEN